MTTTRLFSFGCPTLEVFETHSLRAKELCATHIMITADLPHARGENVLRFGPDFIHQLKLKTDIMNAHCQDYKRLFETPNP